MEAGPLRERPWLSACKPRGVVKLTRLNQQTVAINPENILWADATPDTTLCLTGGEKILVRESLDELLDLVIAYQRAIRRERHDFRNDAEAP